MPVCWQTEIDKTLENNHTRNVLAHACCPWPDGRMWRLDGMSQCKESGSRMCRGDNGGQLTMDEGAQQRQVPRSVVRGNPRAWGRPQVYRKTNSMKLWTRHNNRSQRSRHGGLQYVTVTKTCTQSEGLEAGISFSEKPRTHTNIANSGRIAQEQSQKRRQQENGVQLQ